MVGVKGWAVIKQRSSTMWTLLNLIYREYCRASLGDMRKRHF